MSSIHVADGFEPAGLDVIGLEELGAAELRDRIDVKYIVDHAQLARLLDDLAVTHRVLEIDARRVFRYRSIYYDTPDLLTFREHRQGRRRRLKCRKRSYLDGGVTMLEAKLKGPRGRTVKTSQPCAGDDTLSAEDFEFFAAATRDAYGRDLTSLELHPTLPVLCHRFTLVAPERRERVTCDVLVHLGTGRLREHLAIVESKSPAGRALTDRALRRLGERPVSWCSKYCVGIALSRPEVHANGLLPLLRRYFEPAPYIDPLLEPKEHV